MTTRARSRSDYSAFDAEEDARELPAYGLVEAATYLQVPASTLRSWVAGREYPTRRGPAQFRPLIRPAAADPVLLSFFNLVEAHVLAAIRQEHGVALAQVRRSLDFVERHRPVKHPLAERRFETDGMDLFVRELGRLVSASAGGQLGIREVLDARLQRIEWDRKGVAARLFPFTRGSRLDPEAPKPIVIDPRISFGRAVLSGTRIPVEVVADRFKAGESVAELARDYGVREQAIEEACRCELVLRAA